MQQERIRVRMYRNILGDCFLLVHEKPDAEKGELRRTNVLIDCGVLQGVKGGRDMIRRIAEDVVNEAERRFDLVVLTHEHADHLSGFAHAYDIFFAPDVRMNELWLAWTENATDPQAQALQARFRRSRRALALTASLALDDAKAQAHVDKVKALHDFVAFRLDKEEQKAAEAVAAGTAAGARKAPRSGRQVIEALKGKAGSGGIAYLEPGEIRLLADKAIRAFVLGPPRDMARLRKDAPSSGPAKEVYLATLDEAAAVESAARAAGGALKLAGEEEGDRPAAAAPDESSPFARPHHCKIDDAKKRGWAVATSYFANESLQIGKDWLAAAESLALKLDSDTNNTSLVLAFELADRQVLLFPGDAQVGNWLSWSDQTYPREAEKDGPAPIVVDDLLRRVTLYKVGHHASHNATLRDRGLERMADPRLIAMIPVVEKVALQQGTKGWKMPYEHLADRLKEKTADRVVRGDGDVEREKQAFVGERSHADVVHSPDGLWVEVILPVG